MILEYTLGPRQYRKYLLFPSLKQVAIIAAGSFVGVIWFGTGGHLLFVLGITWAWFFLLRLLPLLIIGIRHSQLSKGAYFSIDTDNNTCQYKEKGISLSFRLTEIDKVTIVVSPPKYDVRADFPGFGHFFYWKIILVDGRALSISCMLLDLEYFPGKEIGREKRVFPVPSSNQHLRL